jgi:hypothetical protein
MRPGILPKSREWAWLLQLLLLSTLLLLLLWRRLLLLWRLLLLRLQMLLWHCWLIPGSLLRQLLLLL